MAEALRDYDDTGVDDVDETGRGQDPPDSASVFLCEVADVAAGEESGELRLGSAA